MIPDTYYPVPTQQLFARNAARIKGKPYAKYFNGDMHLHEEILPALKTQMPTASTIRSDEASLNTLLEPGYHDVETGFGLSEVGSPYVASLTQFPGCTPAMFTWWFWWHSVEPERYTLWFPWNHVQAIPRNQDVLHQPGLSDAERYIGNTHDIVEYVGSVRSDLVIEFVHPTQLGFDAAAFEASDYQAHACGRVTGGVMLHLVRPTSSGFELRSRYIFDRGAPPNQESPSGAGTPDVDAANPALDFAYELMLHDQLEFTHLATFLADIYEEFGNAAIDG